MTGDESAAVDDVTGTPTADEIFGRRFASTSRPSPGTVLRLGIELLPTIEDDLTADFVEYVLLALVDRDEALLAVRTVLSAALKHLNTLQVETIRLQRRINVLRETQRSRRTET